MGVTVTDANNKLRIGVVLSSGGGRGVFAHTGFLQALEQLDIEIAAIAGCSAGALVGGIYASGTKLSQWTKTLAKVHPRDYWTPDSRLKFLWSMIVRKGRGYTGLSSPQTAIKFIRQQLAVQTFEDCKIPFHSLAMNLTRSTKTLFGEGELAPRIIASAAVPILYRPVEIDGEWFSDGASLDLAPTDAVCCKHNLDVLLVHHAAMHREGKAGLAHVLKQPWSLLELLYLQLYSERPWYLTNKALFETRCQCGCGARVIVLKPDLPELSWSLDNKGDAIQELAIMNAIEQLSKKNQNGKSATSMLAITRGYQNCAKRNK